MLLVIFSDRKQCRMSDRADGKKVERGDCKASRDAEWLNRCLFLSSQRDVGAVQQNAAEKEDPQRNQKDPRSLFFSFFNG